MKKLLKFLFNYMNILIFLTILITTFFYMGFQDSPSEYHIPKLTNLFFFITYVPLLILIYLKVLTKIFKSKILHFILNIIGTIYALYFSFLTYVICVMHIALIRYVYVF